ncbi:MAG: hypothetical protein IKE60_21875, partial [Reyranella sp.]|uniref:hypothetical protein n=1 Tax=Reyranella sp. TaxID=1929291 RepID=UPI0025E56ABF
MAAGFLSIESKRLWPAIAVVVAAVVGLLVVLPEDRITGEPTVGDRLIAVRTDRAALQARADGVARLELLEALRVAGLLGDTLIARDEPLRDRAFGRLPERRRQAFAELEALNAALRDALERPGEGARLAAQQAA